MSERRSSDTFAHSNAAYSANALAWLCRGYANGAIKSTRDPGLPFIWAIVGLCLVSPNGVRAALPRGQTAKLQILFRDHPEWKAILPDAIRGWVKPFWEGLRLGAASGILGVAKGRIILISEPSASDAEFAERLKTACVVFGRMISRLSDAELQMILGIGVTV
jgi:hypothetical protein